MFTAAIWQFANRHVDRGADVALDGRDHQRQVGLAAIDATATLLAPQVVERMLAKRHGESASSINGVNATKKLLRLRRTDNHDRLAREGQFKPIYQFDHWTWSAAKTSVSYSKTADY